MDRSRPPQPPAGPGRLRPGRSAWRGVEMGGGTPGGRRPPERETRRGHATAALMKGLATRCPLARFPLETRDGSWTWQGMSGSGAWIAGVRTIGVMVTMPLAGCPGAAYGWTSPGTCAALSETGMTPGSGASTWASGWRAGVVTLNAGAPSSVCCATIQGPPAGRRASEPRPRWRWARRVRGSFGTGRDHLLDERVSVQNGAQAATSRPLSGKTGIEFPFCLTCPH